MNVDALVERYITHRKALGARFRTASHTLRSFSTTVGTTTDIADVRPDQVGAFLYRPGPVTRAWHVHHATLAVFFRYAVSRGYLSAAPLPSFVPKVTRRFVPYIYSHDDLRRLLQATACPFVVRSNIEPCTLRTLLLLLYAAGLRISEAIALNHDDVDLTNCVLTVRRTKFFKTRLVPFGSPLAKALMEYTNRPHRATTCRELSSPFFTTKQDKRLCQMTVQRLFQRIREHSGVKRDSNARYQPRLHDLRHTFAVHRLTAWYRDGQDVQRLLPYLSTYLGHRRLSGTMFYLTMTPDVLHEASKRFENYFMETNNDE
jgi:integrase/recombinase XerD